MTPEDKEKFKKEFEDRRGELGLDEIQGGHMRSRNRPDIEFHFSADRIMGSLWEYRPDGTVIKHKP